MFKTNVGGIDRVLRIVIGLVLIVLAAMGTIGVWGYIGVVPLLTGLVRTCPAYGLLGVNTCPMKSAAK
jgi:membrane-bound ClpP family serine protease